MNAEQAEAAGVTVAKAGVIVFSSQLPSNDVWMWIAFRVPEPLLRDSLAGTVLEIKLKYLLQV